MKFIFAALLALWSGWAASQGLPFPGPGASSSGVNQLLANQLNGDTSGLTNLEFRNVISSGALASISGTKIQVALVPNTTTSATVSLAYVGMKGAAAPNYDGGQKQLLFGGSGSVTLTGGGPPILSDVTTFTYTSGTDLVVCLLMTATFSARTNTAAGANFNRYAWAAGSNCPNTTAPGSPTLFNNQIEAVGSIYVQ